MTCTVLHVRAAGYGQTNAYSITPKDKQRTQTYL
jgi:hypothetical protein